MELGCLRCLRDSVFARFMCTACAYIRLVLNGLICDEGTHFRPRLC